MLEQINPLWGIYLKHKEQGQPLVLATLVKTVGSSYKKAGAMMLIEQDRTTHGLISGGCLEADVAEHAMTVFETKQACQLTYDLSDESIFGLGAGCDGTIHLVLQLLKDDYLPFSALNPLPGKSISLQLYIESENNSQYPVGSYYLLKNQQMLESTAGFYQAVSDSTSPLHYHPPPKIAICGAGIDVIPVLHVLHLLQWHVTLIDHAAGRLTQTTQHLNTQTIQVNPDDLNATLSGHDFAAVIIMSHHLERDAEYLKYFAATKTQWMGLLGPLKRRDKVLQKAQLTLSQLQQRLKSPVGLDIGGQMPENIAISVAAQLQQHFYQT
ncbi:XdhC family protein [Marinicella litoralis]|uniref:Xanthine/CO dehydrogenase XdhC/CoxF family maturation factor n=1 Tax=Marinicella litoralis TaxID=644220 RepID=A0A4R6XLT5_9GAMM|nr:XdhC family protein [Marinicella litoralis]TDR20602.1 xanthine/CO dehydrogenase XdhC/CoxF family maturation factor [Marinicella litoralis]